MTKQALVKRVVSFDIMRVIAIIGILICHSCNKFPIYYDWIASYCACTFNFLFLILSAFLMGVSWENNGRKVLGKSFLSKRLVRLSSSYYPFLIILFLLLYFSGRPIYFHTIATHILYLPWFDKIGGFHHLWFMTLIIICYVACAYSTRLRVREGLFWSIGAIITIVYSILSVYIGLPSYLCMYVYLYLFVFNYSNRILLQFKNITRKQIALISFPVIVLCVLYFYYYNATSKVLPYIIGIISASSIFALIYKFCSSVNSISIVVFISVISFEIYLIHMIFLNYINIYSMIHSVYVSFLLLMIFSIICAFILHSLSDFINKYLIRNR